MPASEEDHEQQQRVGHRGRNGAPQDRPVQIHRLISDGTIEDRIATVLAQKQALADAVVGGGEAWLTEMSDVELAALVRLGDEDRS